MSFSVFGVPYKDTRGFPKPFSWNAGESTFLFQVREMLLIIIALAWGIKSGKGRKSSKEKGKQRERWSHLRVKAVTLTLSGGLRNPSVMIFSCSRVMARSRFLSSFHPHPHLSLLLLIGSDWIRPADAKHTQCPAQGLRAEACNTPILWQKVQQKTGTAAITLPYHYYYYNGTNLTYVNKDKNYMFFS